LLIAGELDLKVPEISFADLSEFLDDTKDIHERIQGMSREETVYSQRNLKPYPWTRRILEVNGKPFYNYRSKPPFTNLMSIIDQLPIVPDTRVILLLYQHEQSNYDFNWHFDKDRQFGFRLCLGLDTDKPFLEFARMHNEFLDYAKDHTEKSVILEKHMINENKIYSITPTRSNSVICINGYEYCHRVPIVNASTRASFVIRGELTSNEFNLKQKVEDELYS
jgi:hypothetical protein